jgi:putative transposase
MAVSTYYYQKKLCSDMSLQEDLDLKERIDRVHIKYPYYGYRRIKTELANEGEVVNHKRLKRVIKRFGLFAEVPRSYKLTTQSRHGHRRYKNMVGKIRAVQPNHIWATDMTYIRVASSFVYLAVVIDLFSRKVVGWAIGPRLNRELALAALNQAIKERAPPGGCIHHSDQGVQYCSDEYIELLERHSFQISMSRTGNPYDNAFVESFMRTLKMEEVYLASYQNYEDVIEKVSRFIADVYNCKRLHSSLGYQSPMEYEANYNRTI